VLGEVGTDGSDGVFRDGLSPLFQVLDKPGERTEVMEDQAVGDQVVVLDGFALLVPAVLRDDAFAAEEGPLEEAVKGLALVGGALDG
jgi:hypothetical protein